jgi:hypothetical protein
MTRLDKPVTRESAVFDRGRALIVSLHPRHLEIRPKGTRTRYTASYDQIMWLAVRRQHQEEQAAKAAARKPKSKPRR